MDDVLSDIPSAAPVFPLPEVVLFPNMLVPLHIFEPRYKDLAADAIAGNRYVALAMLREGYEPLYYTLRAPVHSTVGVGQIVSAEQVEDGKYNVLVRGIGRAEIVEENREGTYRIARLEAIATFCAAGESAAQKIRAELFDAIRENPALEGDVRRTWLEWEDEQLDLDVLADVLSAGVPAGADLRQCLLAEPDAAERARMVLAQLRTVADIAAQQRRLGPTSDPNQN